MRPTTKASAAPTATVLVPTIATAEAKRSWVTLSLASVFGFESVWRSVPVFRSNRYASPTICGPAMYRHGAPTTAIFLLPATDQPKYDICGTGLVRTATGLPAWASPADSDMIATRRTAARHQQVVDGTRMSLIR